MLDDVYSRCIGTNSHLYKFDSCILFLYPVLRVYFPFISIQEQKKLYNAIMLYVERSFGEMQDIYNLPTYAPVSLIYLCSGMVAMNDMVDTDDVPHSGCCGWERFNSNLIGSFLGSPPTEAAQCHLTVILSFIKILGEQCQIPAAP